MKCIQVLPILKHTFSEELTYWTLHNFSIGDVITVTLNKRQIYAVVSSVFTLSEAKEFIKSRDFAVKKIETYTQVDIFSSDFIKACLYTSKYFIRSFGEILSEYIPKKILENLATLKTPDRLPISIQKNETRYVQKQFTDQITYITELQSLYDHITIVVPTDAHKTHIKNALTSTAGITIITPIDTYVLDTTRVEMCILAYAGSEYYRHLRKHFDTRITIREYCRLRNLELVEMDAILPIYKNESIEKNIGPIQAVPFIHIVDQTESKTARVAKKTHSKKNFTPKPEDESDVRTIMEGHIDVVSHKKLKRISPELYSLIMHAEKLREDVFIYTTRKGLSTSVTCSDCGHILTCEICKKPFSLKEVKGVRTFTCPLAHSTPPTDTPCPVCGNMNLTLLGSGTDALQEELQGTVDMPIVVIDGDHMTQSAARNIFKKRKEKTHVPTIYIGTELALHQGMEESFAFSGIASLETLLALPSRIAELETIRVIETLREKTTDTLVIQTRHAEHALWKCLQKKNWSELITQITNDTKILNLPPFASHIQIHISSKYVSGIKDMVTIRTFLQKYISVDTLDQTLHIYSKDWPIDPLYKYLKSLPAYIRVEVDSPSLM